MKLTCTALSLFLALPLASAAPAADEPSPAAPAMAVDCEAYREYFTTYNFLMDRKQQAYSKDKASRTALKVARHCAGAAQRFIQVYEVLVKTELSLDQVEGIALEMAGADEDAAERFRVIFKTAYLQELLDLPLADSVRLARTLSGVRSLAGTDFKSDFSALVAFCLAKEGLALPKPACARLSEEIASRDARQSVSPAAAFIELFAFLRDAADGPRLASYQAIDLARSIVTVSSDGARSFAKAYRFARGKEQLALDRNAAVDLASKLAMIVRRPGSPEEGAVELEAKRKP